MCTTNIHPDGFNLGAKVVNYDNTIEIVSFTSTPDSLILNIGSSSAVDVIIIDGSELVINGRQVIDLSIVEDLTFDGGPGDDIFEVISILPILTRINLIGGDGSDTIFGVDAANTWTLKGMNQGNVSGDHPFDFSGVENLVGNASADTFILANDAGGVDGGIDGGDGVDVLDYSARSMAVTVDMGAGTASSVGSLAGVEYLVGSGTTDMFVGPNTTNTWILAGTNAGSLNAGAISFMSFENLTGGTDSDHFLVMAFSNVGGGIDGGPGNDRINLAATGFADNIMVSAPILKYNGVQTSYTGIETIMVQSLAGADRVTINPTLTGFPDVVNLDTAGDDDVITVNLLEGTKTAINIDAGVPSASDKVIINGTAGADTINIVGLIATCSATTISLTDLENLTVNSGEGDDFVTLTGATVTGTVELLGGTDDDTVMLRYPITAGTFTVDGGAGENNSLYVSTTQGDDTVTIRPATVAVGGATTANYSNFALLSVNTTAGNDDITVIDTHDWDTSILSGEDEDTIIVQMTSGPLDVSGDDGVDMVNIRSTGAVTTVNCGAGDDVINVGSLAPLTGGTLHGINGLLTVDGGAGGNTLNVDNTADTSPSTGVLTGSTVMGLGMTRAVDTPDMPTPPVPVVGPEMPGGILYWQFAQLNIGLGSGADDFTIEAPTPARQPWMQTMVRTS